ncbi:16S rRNA (cytidine(1402)-2'-O)-methyltransferase [Paenibacillus thailandensis]|uniref:Ribosomal RNA small subunit methyltransferase I n=1 Tax=Paenibacillus thailandensis TaxID=393250 RepID=A0ABW5R298_9BACL
MSIHVQKSFGGQHEVGTLYLVGTPIGNLEDMTFRAVRTLKEADLIAAEDTRQTRKLLTHYDIQTRLVSYHEHNKQASGPELIRLLQEGKSIALVSDAGLPAISDPGADLVALAAAEAIPVVPVPGANAALSALIVSGLSTERFAFVGFPPRDKKPLGEWLDHCGKLEETIILYESPHRLGRTLSAMLEAWGDRRIAMVRELTKRHEEVARGMISECLARLEEHPPLGEYCLVVEGRKPGSGEGAEDAWWAQLDLEAHVSYYEATYGRKEAIKKVANDRGVPKRDVYNAVNR